MKPSGSFRTAAVLVIVSLFFAVLGTSSPVAATSGDHEVNIVAVGDSYTAGNGATDYDVKTGCHRSYNNYAHQFASKLRSTGLDASVATMACSGAKTSDVPVQINNISSSARDATDIVLLTIGGNDVSFASIVGGCLAIGVRPSCQELLWEANSNIESVRSATRQNLLDIASKFRNAKVVLIGYPYLIARCLNSSWYTTLLNGLPAGEQVRDLSLLADAMQSDLVDELNQTQPGRFFHVRTLDLFEGHEVCSSLLNWINPQFTVYIPGLGFFPSTDWEEWWHPNYLGHQAIAERLFGRRTGLGITSNGYISTSNTYLYSNLPLGCGVVAQYASTYGTIDVSGSLYDHSKAIDLPVPAGTPVVAPATGQAVVKSDPTGYGNYIDITDRDGRVYRMAHMQVTGLLSGNQRVGQGQLIGRVGQTGFATGPHLHYEQRVNGQMVTLSLDGPSLVWKPTDSSGNRYTANALVSGNCEAQSRYIHEEVKFHRNGTTYMINGVTGDVNALWQGVMPGNFRVECDTNGDGESEVYSAEYRNSRWYVMQGTWGQTGEDKGWRTYSSDLNGHTINGLSCGDRDGDGKDEVKLHVSGGFIYLISGSTGATSVLFSGIMTPKGFVECDPDGNGKDEIYSVEYRSGKWYVMRGAKPSATLYSWAAYSTDFYGRSITALSCGDIDGNGQDEVKVHLTGGYIRRINPGGSTTVLYSGIMTPTFRVECDTNGDGSDEIISVEQRGTGWYIMQGERVAAGDYRWRTFYDGYHIHPIQALTCGDKNNL